MVGIFGPLKIDPERKMAQAKTRAKGRLLVPFLIGAFSFGSASLAFQISSHQRNWAQVLGLTGFGGLVGAFIVARENQSGTSESNRQILLAADRMTDAAEGLDETTKIAQERFDAYQFQMVEMNRGMARLQPNLKSTTAAIHRFESGIYNMTHGGGFVTTEQRQYAAQPAPVYEATERSPVYEQVSQPVETVEEPEFPLETAANDYPVTDNYQREGW